MIKGGPDLVSNYLRAFLIAHGKSWIDNQPSQHVECPCIPALRDTCAVHLEHEILHVVEKNSGVSEVVDEVRLNNDATYTESPFECSGASAGVLICFSFFIRNETDRILFMTFRHAFILLLLLFRVLCVLSKSCI